MPQGDPSLARQRYQGMARLLVKAALGRMRDGLLHPGGVHRDPGQAAWRYGT